jgi:hypothetical protein
MTRRIWRWLRELVHPDRARLRVVRCDELPLKMATEAVYVLGEGPNRWFAALLCPCGCRSLVQVSLLPDAEPRWTLTEHTDGSISLYPSIWRKVGCRAHFFVRRSTIVWC